MLHLVKSEARYLSFARSMRRGGAKGEFRQRTISSALKPNLWDLYGLGNAAEWTEDCWNDSYQSAPWDGSARASGNCALHGCAGAPGRATRPPCARRREPTSRTARAGTISAFGSKEHWRTEIGRETARRIHLLRCMSPLVCRFSAAGNDGLTTRCGGRRPKSAKARNRVGR
jgi:hypothetical protein